MRGRITNYLLRCWHSVRIHPGVVSVAAAFYIAGLAVSEPALHWVALVSHSTGTAFLLWGIRIHGMHIWQPWWRGKPSPFNITAGVHSFDYESGSTVAGIPWEKGFAHVWLNIRNESQHSLGDVDVLLIPEHPIIHSRARSALADCRIASHHGGPPQTTVLIEYPDGRRIARTQDPHQPGNYAIGPAHRLHCDRLPSGATVEVDLATVVLELPPSGQRPWKPERTDPSGIRVRSFWMEAGSKYVADQFLELKRVPRD
jgi:hypothetical protein